jgi:hypothetical protein
MVWVIVLIVVAALAGVGIAYLAARGGVRRSPGGGSGDEPGGDA